MKDLAHSLYDCGETETLSRGTLALAHGFALRVQTVPGKLGITTAAAAKHFSEIGS